MHRSRCWRRCGGRSGAEYDFRPHVSQSLLGELKQLQQQRLPMFAVDGNIDDPLREAGVRNAPAIQAYYRAGGADNLANLLRHLLHGEFNAPLTPGPVRILPESGLYDLHANRVAGCVDDFLCGYTSHWPSGASVGIRNAACHRHGPDASAKDHRRGCAAAHWRTGDCIQLLGAQGCIALPKPGGGYSTPRRHPLQANRTPDVIA